MVGLGVTLITQSANSSAHNTPTPPPRTSEGVTPTADPSERPSDDVVTTSSPTPSAASSPSPSPSLSLSLSQTTAKILRTGDFTLLKGHSADLEHGASGVSVKNPDMAWNGGDEFAAMNGRVADTPKGATPKTCAEALRSPSSTGWMVYGLEGSWFCLPTSANHLAAVEWLGFGNGGNRYHYIVWDTAAPADG
ncbi:hypothetical protein [Streptomyces sp. NPDC016845]|uniref:hypothetical protein n=1 Tax=Streptomyces sp. NPDC016845 TaxID=3364972 RepID=UPI0037B9FCF3